MHHGNSLKGLRIATIGEALICNGPIGKIDPITDRAHSIID